MNTLVAEADVITFSVVMYAYKSVCILCQVLMQPVIHDRNLVGGTVTDVAYWCVTEFLKSLIFP